MKKVLLALIIVAAVMAALLFAADHSRVLIKTEAGDIAVELYPDKAPATVANFLRYVDAKLYDGTTFFRTVTLDNQAANPVKIEVIQGGSVREGGFDPIPLERTNKTGLRHLEGAISMARGGPDSATSSFFICINDQPELDFGGKRNKDGQGFAAFGRVVAGMDVVRKIHKSPCQEQNLTPPVKILSVTRAEK